MSIHLEDCRCTCRDHQHCVVSIIQYGPPDPKQEVKMKIIVLYTCTCHTHSILWCLDPDVACSIAVQLLHKQLVELPMGHNHLHLLLGGPGVHVK